MEDMTEHLKHRTLLKGVSTFEVFASLEIVSRLMLEASKRYPSTANALAQNSK